ncbi:MAG TPA: MFS transporter [Stackebrandtia sp.]|jgi:MFS family permease|uniref:MFS transporter n=1 Tax=Stackebrandtia sp. TaxID=2023065 RepID=UPI002D301B00|nr:MFS transporter [Stackebrandtia sp.]HZE40472.1 MFS transporter [Stackebrandtia sp.]
MSFTSKPAASRWGDVYIDAAARFLAQTGMFGVMTALMLQVQTTGEGGLAAAGVTIASMLPMVVLAPLIGRWVDAVDSRVLVIASGAVRIVASLALATTDNVFVLLAYVLLLSVGTAVLQPTLGAMIPAMVTRDDLPRATAIGQSASTLGFIAGPAMAGVLVGQYGPHSAMLVNAVCALATVSAGFLIRTRRGGRFREQSSRDANARAWRPSDDGLIHLMIVGLALIVGVVSAVNVVEVFFIRETMHATTTVYGLVSAAWAVGMAVGAWALARPIKNTSNDRRLLQGMFLSLGLTCAVIASAALVHGSAWWLVPLFLAGGGLNGGENTLVGSLLGRRVPADSRGRANASLNGWLQGLSLFGYAAGGVAVELLSPRITVAACGLVGLAVVFVLVPMMRRARTSTQDEGGPVVEEPAVA